MPRLWAPPLRTPASQPRPAPRARHRAPHPPLPSLPPPHPSIPSTPLTATMPLDPESAAARALQAAVSARLRATLGDGFDNDVLPQYVAVMVCHGSGRAYVAEALGAFLDDGAPAFAKWQAVVGGD